MLKPGDVVAVGYVKFPQTTPVAFTRPAVAAENAQRPAGFAGGGFVGRTMQVGNIVVGIEGDIAGKSAETGVTQSSPTIVVYAPAAAGVTATRTEAFTGSLRQTTEGSLRPRVGLLVTPWTLVYVTGGVACNRVNASFSYLSTVTYAGVPGGLVDTVAGTGSLMGRHRPV